MKEAVSTRVEAVKKKNTTTLRQLYRAPGFLGAWRAFPPSGSTGLGGQALSSLSPLNLSSSMGSRSMQLPVILTISQAKFV
ncbi:hypothetical protein SORBI_3001G451450 [Sorghum bicolor]|uniref:Uncharacterized protein n=1 Tax=Sorghum bicolor TaxID=4558 RepID=A0A1Z5SAN7_SORBI|nr:hypothetical protein SORBI_3001G451450 [Sorghum bicolor]